MSAATHRKQLKGAVAVLKLDLSRLEADAARTRELIAALCLRIEGGKSGNAAVITAVPPKVKHRRRRRRRAVHVTRKPVNGRRTKGSSLAGKLERGARAVVAATVDAPNSLAAKDSKPVPVAAPVRAVRGAAQFAAELKAINEIVAALAKADKALNKAGRAKDTVAVSMLSAEVHQLRRLGNDLLVRLGGKARLPIDKTERMRWRRAAAQPEAKAPKKRKAPRKPTPPIPPPVVKRTEWHPDPDGSGNLVREIITS